MQALPTKDGGWTLGFFGFSDHGAGFSYTAFNQNWETPEDMWKTRFLGVSSIGTINIHIGHSENPSKGGTGSTKTPCDVKVPADQNDRAVLGTLMGEAFYPGSPLYTNATNDGRGNSSHEEAKHPESYSSVDDTQSEMEYMVSVFVNRQNDTPNHPSFYDIANSKQTNGKYQFEGYPNGNDQLNNLGEQGSAACEQAAIGLRAMASIKTNGPVNKNIHWWHGVLQQDKKGKFVRVRNGAIRIGGTDFW